MASISAVVAQDMSPETPPSGSSQPAFFVASESRSATPVAPTPVRRVVNLGMQSPPPPGHGYGYLPNGNMDNMKAGSGRSLLASPLMDLPLPSTPVATVRENQVTSLAAFYSKSIATPALLSQFKLQTPNLLVRQGWETSTAQRAYGWALQNPRTALLFLICEDMSAWPKSVIFGLEDSMLPYQVADLHGIASDPNRAVQMQWHVTSRELPRNGQYVEFSSKEIVPLHQTARISTTGRISNSLDKVSWYGESSSKIYVRKRFICSRPSVKSTVHAQIAAFKKLEHPHIATVLSWYSQGSVVGIVTSCAQYDLDEYLKLPSGLIQPRYMLDWIHQLTQALEYIHSHGVSHGGIKPQKVLIDHNFRAYFSAFGISSDGPEMSPPRSATMPSSPTYAPGQKPLSAQAYVYAAPELAANRKTGRPSDVFSLGCVFLTMLTLALGHTSTLFTAFRSQLTRDESFHANLDRVGTWIKQLQMHAAAGRSGPVASAAAQMREKAAGAVSTESQALAFVAAMIVPEPGRRVKMKRLAPFIARWNESRGLMRRRSFDAGTSTSSSSGRWPNGDNVDTYFSGAR
jgi:serine/threonine protein kinase